MDKKISSIYDESKRILTVEMVNSTPTATVIFLQGIGTIPETFQPGGGWKEVALYWVQQLPYIRVVLPSAPAPRASWFDNGAGLEKAKENLNILIENEAKRLLGGSRRIVLSGFSQGAMLALYGGLQRYAPNDLKPPIGGIFACSGFVPGRGPVCKALENANQDELKRLQVVIGWGAADGMGGGVGRVKKDRDALVEAGLANIHIQIYEGMGHVSWSISRMGSTFPCDVVFINIILFICNECYDLLFYLY